MKFSLALFGLGFQIVFVLIRIIARLGQIRNNLDFTAGKPHVRNGGEFFLRQESQTSCGTPAVFRARLDLAAKPRPIECRGGIRTDVFVIAEPGFRVGHGQVDKVAAVFVCVGTIFVAFEAPAGAHGVFALLNAKSDILTGRHLGIFPSPPRDESHPVRVVGDFGSHFFVLSERRQRHVM